VSVVFSLAELADLLGAELRGDPDKRLSGVKPLAEAGSDDLSFLHNPRYSAQAQQSAAGALILEKAAGFENRNLLLTSEPYLAFAHALAAFFPVQRPDPGVHPSAVVAEDAVCEPGASIGPLVAIGVGSHIAAGTVVGAGCVIGRGVEIGPDCLLHPRVVVEDECRIGARCVLNPGVVIGGDGYGFASVDGVHHKVPQVGIVVIEDDVELGANVCVDRATLGETRIGRGSKIDNLVQVAHNVEIGRGALLVSQVGIAGSTRLGEYVTMAGQSGVAGHLELGDGVIVGAKSAVFKDVPKGSFVTGIPAQPHHKWLKTNAGVRRVLGLQERVKKLEQRLTMLEASLEGKLHD